MSARLSLGSGEVKNDIAWQEKFGLHRNRTYFSKTSIFSYEGINNKIFIWNVSHQTIVFQSSFGETSASNSTSGSAASSETDESEKDDLLRRFKDLQNELNNVRGLMEELNVKKVKCDF